MLGSRAVGHGRSCRAPTRARGATWQTSHLLARFFASFARTSSVPTARAAGAKAQRQAGSERPSRCLESMKARFKVEGTEPGRPIACGGFFFFFSFFRAIACDGDGSTTANGRIGFPTRDRRGVRFRARPAPGLLFADAQFAWNKIYVCLDLCKNQSNHSHRRFVTFLKNKQRRALKTNSEW